VRVQREDLALDAGDAFGRQLVHVVQVEHVALVRRQQRREAVLGLLLLHDHKLGLGNQAVNHIILAQHLARLAVQRFQSFVLVVYEIAVMLDPRRMDDAAALINQRTNVVLPLGSTMDLVQPRRGVTAVQRGVRRLRSRGGSGQT
jgi:hypothetical protein